MDANEKRLAECQRVIGYYFAQPRLLETALTHSSLRQPDRECNERLEFLGDSVLGLVVTEELYNLLPDQNEGELTRIKSALVSRTALHVVSKRLGLEHFALFARGVGKRDRLPASVVANLVESVIGAIYLDAGYYPAREFVLRHLGRELEDELQDRGAKNYKSLLQHAVQQGLGATPTYRTLREEGPEHAKEFEVAALIRGQEWGRAVGPTKKDAEQEAARLALEAFERRGRGRRRRKKAEALDAEAPRGAGPEALLALPAPDPADLGALAGAQAVAEGPLVAGAPAAEAGEGGRPRRRRRRRRRPGEGGAQAVPPAAPKVATNGPREAPKPPPDPAPAPPPPDEFGAGLGLAPAPPAPRPPAVRIRGEPLEAPARRKAPPPAPPPDEGGFASGILDDAG